MALRIEAYRPEWKSYFDQLNRAWLEEYFTVEPIDQWVLENPEEAILKDGGAIFFVTEDDKVIGTAALRWISPDVLELTKMAVAKAWRGKGAGKLLCQAAIDKAKASGVQRLILYSQTSLAPAIGIYRSLGFQEIPLEKGVYKRADIKMEIVF